MRDNGNGRKKAIKCPLKTTWFLAQAHTGAKPHFARRRKKGTKRKGTFVVLPPSSIVPRGSNTGIDHSPLQGPKYCPITIDGKSSQFSAI